MEGYRRKATYGSFIIPYGRGECFILSQINCTYTGLLDQCMPLFRGAKSNKSADCHLEMNWDEFSYWCQIKVFPSIAATGVNSVAVLDRATFHNTLDEEDKIPATLWNKPRLIEDIKRWGGAPSDRPMNWMKGKTKIQLLDYARRINPSVKYRIQKIAYKFDKDAFSINILLLPE